MSEQHADTALDRVTPRINVSDNGPYEVRGGVPLRRVRPVTNDQGAKVGWAADEPLATEDTYWLCRCGQSASKPFCDGSHRRVAFDGTEAAPTDSLAERATDYPAGPVTVHDDRALCEHAGFCGNEATTVWRMTKSADDDPTRAEMTAMIGRCPSGALSYSEGGNPVEPELQLEVAVIDDGPIWVTGRVEVQRADGRPFETRNRMTLCRCGQSASKPLCDGSHAKAGFADR